MHVVADTIQEQTDSISGVTLQATALSHCSKNVMVPVNAVLYKFEHCCVLDARNGGSHQLNKCKLHWKSNTRPRVLDVGPIPFETALRTTVCGHISWLLQEWNELNLRLSEYDNYEHAFQHRMMIMTGTFTSTNNSFPLGIWEFFIFHHSHCCMTTTCWPYVCMCVHVSVCVCKLNQNAALLHLNSIMLLISAQVKRALFSLKKNGSVLCNLIQV